MLKTYIVKKTKTFHTKLLEYIKTIYSINPDIAKKIYNSINKELYSLDILPRRYHHLDKNNYCFVHKNYRIYYKVDDEEFVVYILNIIHTRQNDKNYR